MYQNAVMQLGGVKFLFLVCDFIFFFFLLRGDKAREIHSKFIGLAYLL